MKKIIALLLATMMVFGLAACGNSASSSSGSSSEESSVPESSVEVASSEESSTEPVEVVLEDSDWSGYETEVIHGVSETIGDTYMTFRVGKPAVEGSTTLVYTGETLTLNFNASTTVTIDGVEASLADLSGDTTYVITYAPEVMGVISIVR